MASEFALVHGMSHGAWAWAEVQTRLERAGHRVVAVDLPGHGRRAHERQRASIESYARAVTDAMALMGLHRAVVVGHSMGGAVIQKVAELAPARVAHLVVLAAIVLPSGSSLLETQVGPATRAVFTGLARTGGGAIQLPAAMEWARWLGDMTPGDSRVVETLIRLTPQPLRPWTERVDLRRFYAMRVPRTYIRCRRDAAVSFARAGEYAARLGVEPIDLDTAHEPMLSDPDALVAILERCANRGAKEASVRRPDR